MTNRIRDLKITQRRWNPVEAELWITVWPETLAPSTEIRGTVVGPRGPGRSTIEVAYPLRPVKKLTEEPGTLTARVILPEPCDWEPESPMTYEGLVELWQDGQCCERRIIEIRGRKQTLNAER